MRTTISGGIGLCCADAAPTIVAATEAKAVFDGAIPDTPCFPDVSPDMTEPGPELYRFRRDDALHLRYVTAWNL